MNTAQRKKFWKKLEEITLDELPDLISWLGAFSPRTFFRYRAITPYSMSDLNKNQFSFSRASTFDDPFDTLIHVDYYKVMNDLQKSSSFIVNPRKRISELTGLSEENLKILSSCINIQDVFKEDNFQDVIRYYKQSIRKHLCIACLAETYRNENLWLKYANNHSGYCLEYDFQSSETFCDREKVQEDTYGYLTIPAFPVFYSLEPLDATEIFKSEVIESTAKMLHILGEDRVADEIAKYINPWKEIEIYRMALIKHKCHEYDGEWRMFYLYKTSNDYPKISLQPISVTIGMRTNVEDTNLIIEAAENAGIQKIFKMELNIMDELERVQIR